MKVILLQNIPSVGRRDDIKDVREGYARNFLFPQKLAVLATQEVIKKLEQEKAKKEERLHAHRTKYEEAREKLKNITITFRMKMGEKGKAFGSVSEEDIAQELKKQGVRVEKGWIALAEHIKTTGTHAVPIQFPHSIRGEVNVTVEAETDS